MIKEGEKRPPTIGIFPPEVETGPGMPVKAALSLAVASSFVVVSLVTGAMVPSRVLVANVVKVVYLRLVLQDARCDGMDRCIAPSLVEEATLLV